MSSLWVTSQGHNKTMDCEPVGLIMELCLKVVIQIPLLLHSYYKILLTLRHNNTIKQNRCTASHLLCPERVTHNDPIINWRC